MGASLVTWTALLYQSNCICITYNYRTFAMYKHYLLSMHYISCNPHQNLMKLLLLILFCRRGNRLRKVVTSSKLVFYQLYFQNSPMKYAGQDHDHCTDEVTGAQKGKRTSPRSQNRNFSPVRPVRSLHSYQLSPLL